MSRENELINEAIAGSEEAFTELIRLNQAKVRAFLYSYTRDFNVAYDLAQEVFIAAYQSLSKFKQESELSTWLLGIAKRRLWNYRRSETRRQKRETCLLESAMDDFRVELHGSEEAVMDSREHRISALEDCVQRLEGDSAKVIQEFYYNRSKTDAIAELLDRSAGSIRVMMLRIRHSLKSCIKKRITQELSA